MALDVGTVVAGYTIEGVLGAGGMGTVYRARNPSLPRSDALKILSAELSQDPDFRTRFIREAELAATLDHPNIVAVYSRGETEQHQLWIAMQYVAGTDADKELRAARMTPARATLVTTEVAKALDYAHRRGLLHRDVKPGNFLMTAGDERIFLADFGIARAMDDAVNLTQTGVVMASVAYAAPESLAGLNVDHRADIYSLGCALYRMLVGKAPFSRSGGMAAVVAAHLSDPPPKVTDALPQLPPAIDDVIAKALAKNPDQRYQNARELAEAAADALDDTTTAYRITPPPAAGTAPWSITPTGISGQSPSAAHAVTQPAGTHPPPPGPPGGSGPPPGYPGSPDHETPVGVPRPAPPPALVSPPTKPPKRRRVLIGAAIVTVLVVAAVLTGVLITHGVGVQAYPPQSFTHVHGTTEVKSLPTAIAAIGPGDGDAVLSLGLQPVAIGASGTTLPSWEKTAATANPAVLSGFLDTNAIATAKPDLIIATGDIDDATYTKLTAIAPTITRPVANADAPWTWQQQLTWVAKILGREDKATALLATVRSQSDDLKNQNPKFNGKTVQAMTVTDDGVNQVLIPSNTASYLESLGLRYNDALGRLATDTGTTRPLEQLTAINQVNTDVLVVIRTDKAAGAGGFAGLPQPFSYYRGLMIIVDAPDVIAALADPGGFLATEYLNSTFVPDVVRQLG
jgi:serine/threonine protein kinase/ABC-type Fe3+-hydroxamate transport system substrate-binding protein